MDTNRQFTKEDTQIPVKLGKILSLSINQSAN